MGKTSKRTRGRDGLLTQWIAKYGYLPILIGMVGLALDIGTREWKSDDVIVADAPVVAEPSVVAEAPVVAETFVERRPPTVEIKVEPKPTMQLTAPVMAEDSVEPPLPTVETKLEPKPTVQVAALNPDVRLPDVSDQPASKGYIMYANSPMNWTPVSLPDEISAVHAPHTNNIRAEIEHAATLFDVDVRMMKAFARIESGYNPKAKTGSYKCLFQLSNWEFAKYWQGNIYDIRDCSIAAARKFATEAAQFEKDVGRKATAAELYCIQKLFEAVCDLGLEGIVSKRLTSVYRSGPSRTWVKVKNPKAPAATRTIDGTF